MSTVRLMIGNYIFFIHNIYSPPPPSTPRVAPPIANRSKLNSNCMVKRDTSYCRRQYLNCSTIITTDVTITMLSVSSLITLLLQWLLNSVKNVNCFLEILTVFDFRIMYLGAYELKTRG